MPLLCHKVVLELKIMFTVRIVSGYYMMVAILHTCAAAKSTESANQLFWLQSDYGSPFLVTIAKE